MRFLTIFLLLLSMMFGASPRITTTMSMQELNKLTASDGAANDRFGISVAISGDTVVVGSVYVYAPGITPGSVYLYERDIATGLFQQVAKLTASDGAIGDYFGVSVAISGDTVVVGANGDDDSGSVYLYKKPSSGWANTSQESAKLLASDGADYDNFGKSVAISGDTVIVGAHDDNSGIYSDIYSGSVYLYEKPAKGWADTSQESAKLLASDGADHDEFGFSVAISGDTVVVGAHGDDDPRSGSGSVYLYEKPGGGWADTSQESAKLLAFDGAANDRFGISVAISGDTVVVGADGDDDSGIGSGSAYLYEKPGGGWADTSQESAKLLAFDGADDDNFGVSIAISGDTVVVGADNDDDSGIGSGSVYLYEKPGGGWADTSQESAKLLASDGAASDYFSRNVAISGDTVVVGAYGDDDLGSASGSAYIFKNAITQNSIENKRDIIDIEANDADGDIISFSLMGGVDLSFFSIDASTGLLSFKSAPDFESPQDADHDNIYKATLKVSDDQGESDTYSVSIRISDVAYEGPMPKAISFEELHKLTASNGEGENFFGYSTAIDDTTLVIGAYGYNGNTGKVYIYEYNSASKYFEEVAQLRASDGADSDYFGRNVAISGDTVVVGADGDDDDSGIGSGSAYIYEKPGSGWADTSQESAKLLASDGAAYDNFGISVTISGDTVAVGANGDDDLGDYSGSAYLYEKPGGGWADTSQESAKLLASDGADSDNFGKSVAISGDTVVVGAYDDYSGTYSGSAYLYEKPSSGWADTSQESAKLLASDGADSDNFGISVAISRDTVVVGANGDDDSGIGSGSAYLYEKPAKGWADTSQESAKLLASDGTDHDEFGISVAISGDTVVVGANGDTAFDDYPGSVYLYEKPSSGWADTSQESAKLLASDGAAFDYFGASVAISGDTIVVGANGDDDLGSGSGSTYIFKSSNSGISPAIIMYLLN